MHLAVTHGHKDIVTNLIQFNVEIDKMNLDSDTPLSLACMEGSIEVAKLLITHGANFNFRYGEKQNTLLHLGKNFNSNFSLKILLSNNVFFSSLFSCPKRTY